MDEMNERAQAAVAEDLGRIFIERARSGDVEDLVALYEPGAVLALPDGGTATGRTRSASSTKRSSPSSRRSSPGPLGRHSAMVTGR
jgi:hypothetical protein